MKDIYYASAYVKAKEKNLFSDADFDAFLSGDTDTELRLLEAHGYDVQKDGSGAFLRDETLERHLSLAYETAKELCPDSPAVGLWQYPYDCNNVKSILKCRERKILPTSMLSDCSSVSPEDALTAADTGDYSLFPSRIAAAVPAALTAFEKNKNPQSFDASLDRACFADMLSAAEISGNETVLSLVRAKIDGVNILTCLRILRMRLGAAGIFALKDALLDGGKIDRSDLGAWFEQGEAYFLGKLTYTDYSDVSEDFEAGVTELSRAQKATEDAFMKKVREIALTSVGEETVVAFLLANETEVRNLRILLSGKAAGLDAKKIKERMRLSYV